MYNLILVPSLFCPASCKYCFGPVQGTESVSPKGGFSDRCEDKLMDVSTIEYALDFALRMMEESSLMERLPLWNRDVSGCVRVIFHGGEPLSAGISFFKEALPRILKRFQGSVHSKKPLPEGVVLKVNPACSMVEFSLQSNLWLLTEDMCRLFAEYGVGLGVSLDGPEEITDLQRGKGYFQKTMNAIEMARRYDLSVACLSTFTRYSATRINEVYDFFVQEGLDFSFHQAVPPLNEKREDLWSLHPEEYGELLVNLFDRYIEHLPGIKIDTLDSLCQGVATGKGCICTFTDCLGNFFAIAPDGGIYPCQRFIAQEDNILGNGFCLGNVRDYSNIHDLRAHPFWQYLEQRQDVVNRAVPASSDCGGCAYLPFCRGGCVYNTLSLGDKSSKDPYCLAYKRIYEHIINRAISEVFSEENIAIVVKEGGGLIKKGRLLELMSRLS